MRPKRRTLNCVLPGAGKVIVAQPTLVALDTSKQWWTEPQAGLFGGVLGALVGILGGLIGLSTAWSKLQPLTLPLYLVGLAISGVSLLAGIAALCLGQPWHVHYPLLLVGLIGVVVLGFNLWQQFQRFQADELRRITAVDA